MAELDHLSEGRPVDGGFTAASYGFWTAMESGDVPECKRRVQAMREIIEVVNMPGLVALTMHWQSVLTTCSVRSTMPRRRLARRPNCGARSVAEDAAHLRRRSAIPAVRGTSGDSAT